MTFVLQEVIEELEGRIILVAFNKMYCCAHFLIVKCVISVYTHTDDGFSLNRNDYYTYVYCAHN